MKIVKMEIRQISQRDMSILTITTDVDYRGKPSIEHLPAAQLQMLTAVAQELKSCWEQVAKEKLTAEEHKDLDHSDSYQE